MKALVLILTLLGLCASAAAQDTLRVQASGDRFLPDSARIQPGDVVEFLPGVAGHTVTSEALGVDVPLDRPVRVRIFEAGRYPYHCSIHAARGMSGLIIARE